MTPLDELRSRIASKQRQPITGHDHLLTTEETEVTFHNVSISSLQTSDIPRNIVVSNHDGSDVADDGPVMELDDPFATAFQEDLNVSFASINPPRYPTRAVSIGKQLTGQCTVLPPLSCTNAFGDLNLSISTLNPPRYPNRLISAGKQTSQHPGPSCESAFKDINISFSALNPPRYPTRAISVGKTKEHNPAVANTGSSGHPMVSPLPMKATAMDPPTKYPVRVRSKPRLYSEDSMLSLRLGKSLKISRKSSQDFGEMKQPKHVSSKRRIKHERPLVPSRSRENNMF